MKMVKSLLLGSAAGLVAVTAGQAADLPVKAKPVEYVKVCSLYGAGFYYMPGTDLCIKIGGWVRAEAAYHSNGNLATSYFGDFNNRLTNEFTMRARGYITADAREQTAYGTARGYLAIGVTSNITGGGGFTGAGGDTTAFSANRAFVQWAGITAGVSQSFYDFYSSAAVLYSAGYIPSEDTGDGGWWVWAYTAQLGNGFSATISAEEKRDAQIIDQTAAGALAMAALPPAAGPGAAVTGTGYGGQIAPDIVGNLRVDQTWGSAQVMAAAHEANAQYFGIPAPLGPFNGHPGDLNWGWVVGAGVKLNFPMVAQGDYFQGEINYTRGATRYVDHGANQDLEFVRGGTIALGLISDCVFGSGGPGNVTNCELTTAWGVNASYEHYWTPQWHQSFVGGYMAVRYDNLANNMLCSGETLGGGVASTAFATPGCDNNWSVWGVGSRLQWDVTKSFYLGVDVVYNKYISAKTPTGTLGGLAALVGGAGVGLATNTAIKNQDNVVIRARMHKDFLP